MSTKNYPKWQEAVLIPLDELVPTHWNANEMGDKDFAALLSEVDSGGFDEPLQVVPITKGDNKGKYLILGGEHRYKSGIAHALESLPCVIKKHLNPEDESALMMWSVQRNNLRGRLNSQKYMQIQNAIVDRLGISKKAAQQRMMLRDEQMGKLGDIGRQIAQDEVSPDEIREQLGLDAPDTDGAIERQKTLAERKRLLKNLKAIEQDVLLESGDTVDHGYLFFGQGGKQHLVVEESKILYTLIGKMVNVCKNKSDSINNFLSDAIKKELPNWE